MAKSDDAKAREQRLAAKLRENLKRRKGQAKARSGGKSTSSAGRTPATTGEGGDS